MRVPTRPILLVDDNSDVLEVVKLMLEGEGYSVRTAANGAEALESLRDGVDPCLIILDLTMPVMDGWQFRERQLEDPRLRDIPTIIYSAVGGIANPERPLGPATTLAKGSDIVEMLRLVAELCRRP